MQTKNIYMDPVQGVDKISPKTYFLSGFYGKQHAFFHGFGAHVFLFSQKGAPVLRLAPLSARREGNSLI